MPFFDLICTFVALFFFFSSFFLVDSEDFNLKDERRVGHDSKKKISNIQTHTHIK